MSEQIKTAEGILKEKLKDIHFIRSDETFHRVLDAMEEYAAQQTSQLQSEKEALQELVSNLKQAIITGNRFYGNIKWDDDELTPFMKLQDEKEALQKEVERLKSALKGLIGMAEDGYKLHVKNGSHQEFLSEDREALFNAQEALNPQKQ